MASFLYLTPVCPCNIRLFHSCICPFWGKTVLPETGTHLTETLFHPHTSLLLLQLLLPPPSAVPNNKLYAPGSGKGLFTATYFGHAVMRWTGETSDYWPPQVLGRRVAAVVSLGVATAVVPQQGYAANILTPSVTQASLPLQNVHTSVYTHKYIVPIARLSSSNPVILPPVPFLFDCLKLVLLVPSLAVAFVEGGFLVGLGVSFPSEKLPCSWQINWPFPEGLEPEDSPPRGSAHSPGSGADSAAMGGENGEGEGGYWAVQLAALCLVNLWNTTACNERWLRQH